MPSPLLCNIFLGVILGALPFAAILFTTVFRIPPLAALPLPLTIAAVAATCIYEARRYKDEMGVTFYGKYGHTPAVYLLWTLMYTACVAVAGVAIVFHFPGIGDHYVAKSAAVYPFITEGSCVDASSALGICSPALCNATIAGDIEFQRTFCAAHPQTCRGRRTSYDWALSNCYGTCGCKGVFDPVYQTADGSLFECERTETCYQSRRFNIFWVYVRHPRVVEIHVVTGVYIMLFGPWQFLEIIRKSHNFKFHRWNGRILLLFLIPNQISAAALSTIGLTNDSLGPHMYSKVFRVGLGLMIFFTIVYGSCGFYFIRNNNVKKHGEFMIRLMACWFSIPFFRMLIPFWEAFLGARWTFAASGFCWVFTFVAAEVYIQRSERFVQPSHLGEATVGASSNANGAGTSAW